LTTHRRITLAPTGCAVLAVDLQEEQRASTAFPAHDFDGVLARAARLITAARSHGVAVLYGRYVRDFSTLPPRPFEPLDRAGAPAFSAAGTAGIAICPEVAPRQGEPVFDKQAASCFANDALGDHIAARGIDTLFVCGVWTEACVALTVADALARGLRTFLVKDACGSGSELMHRTGVLNIANRIYGGGVVSAHTCVTLLAGNAAPVWMCEGPVAFRFNADDLDAHYECL
jgi:nicotinamidase-related amidase